MKEQLDMFGVAVSTKDPFFMRVPCTCGSDTGYITRVSQQDTVRCMVCDKFQYNAPRRETGLHG